MVLIPSRAIPADPSRKLGLRPGVVALPAGGSLVSAIIRNGRALGIPPQAASLPPPAGASGRILPGLLRDGT